jgi:large subunit ribosomal protein L23
MIPSRKTIKTKTSAERLNKILISHFVGEKSMSVLQKNNQIVFRVLIDASKNEILEAVENAFNVKVSSVTTLIQKGKVRRFGGRLGRLVNIKKAYISLFPEEKIPDLFGGSD